MDFFIVLIGIASLWWLWRSKPAVSDAEDVCENCGYDVRASKNRCPECGMPLRRAMDHFPLRDDWPADAISPRIPRPDETLVELHMTDIVWEARALSDQLNVRGIAAQIAQPPVIGGSKYGEIKGSWRVMVWSEDLELAAAIRDKLIPKKILEAQEE